MELHVFPIPIPPPTSLSTQFLWVFLWGCLSHLYLQMHVAIWNAVYVLGGGPWGLYCQDA